MCVFASDRTHNTHDESNHRSSEPISCQKSTACMECILSETPLCWGAVMMDEGFLAVHFMQQRVFPLSSGVRALTMAPLPRFTALPLRYAQDCIWKCLFPLSQQEVGHPLHSRLLPLLHLSIDSSSPTSLPASFVVRMKASLPSRKELWL